MAEFTGVVGERCCEQDVERADWFSQHTNLGVSSASFDSLTDHGGLSAAMKKVTVTLSDGSTLGLIYKSTAPNGISRSKDLGLAREALFYHYFGERFRSSLADVVYVYGDMNLGEKVILMKELSGFIQSGYYFGNCSPHNWSKDLAKITGLEVGSHEQLDEMLKITRTANTVAAKIHGAFWKDRSLFSNSWLRACDWMQGEGKESWLVAQNTAKNFWLAEKAKIASGESKVNYSSFLVDCMDASFAKTSWEDHKAKVESPDFSFTLVHGDFHPANMMWNPQTSQLILLDWEVVGLGSGPQDCAQFVISHMSPEHRRVHEEGLLRVYYDELLTAGVSADSFSWEDCKREYVDGGVGRWVWLLGLLTAICPPNWTQFFHDQLEAFIVDHNVTPETIPMPRV